jgi:hypothetical protein
MAIGLTTLGIVVAEIRQIARPGLAAVLLGAAVCYWLVNALEIEPRRVEKRSLRTVAESFEPYLEPGETLWTTPVFEGFRHSSLFFYLRRPVRTMVGTDHPGTGSHIVLFSDEPADQPDYGVPFEYSIVASSSRRGVGFTLARLE